MHCFDGEGKLKMNLMNSDQEAMQKKIISLMERDDSADAPADALKWAKNLYRTRQSATGKTLVQKIKAILQVNIAPNELVFGERSAGASEVRQMLFSAGENSVDLRISKGTKGLNIQGQVLGEGFSECVVTMGKYQATANNMSEFKLINIAKGNYNLVLESGEKHIVIEELELS